MKQSFDDLLNTASITCCHIIEEKMPILYVSHDEDDGAWQFLCGKNHDVSEARVVSLNEICTLDNSITQLLHMPCGYVAERKKRCKDWRISKR